MAYPSSTLYPSGSLYPGTTAGQVLAPAGIATAGAVGSPTVQPGAAIAAASAIASQQAFGTPLLTAEGGPQFVLAAAIASLGAVGVPVVEPAQTLAPGYIASGQAFGGTTVLLGPPVVVPMAITSDEAFGTPGVLMWEDGPAVSGPAEGPGVGGYPTIVLPSIGLLLPRRAEPGYFRVKLTSLHYPGIPGVAPRRRARTLAVLEDFADAEVYIPLNDSRTAKLSLSMGDPLIRTGTLRPYSTQLHFTYVTPNGAHLVMWGIVTLLEYDSENERVTVSVVDHSLRLKSHFVRFGHLILNGSDNAELPNPFNTPGHHHGVGNIPIDAVGLQYLVDAARITDEQAARGVPDIGIALGSDDTDHLPTDTTHVIGIKRGRQCWDAITDLLSHGPSPGFPGSPDFELVPYDAEFGIYAHMRFHTHQGSLTPVALLQDGFGADNCLADYKPGGKLINNAHVLSDGDKDRVTVGDAASEEEYGVYVDWESTSYTSKNTDALEARGKQIIASYGEPPDYFSVKLNADCDLYYFDDFIPGDAVQTQIGRDGLDEDLLGDIASVRLSQIDEAGNVVPDLEVLVQVGDTTADEDS